jgi:hypothetical protein
MIKTRSPGYRSGSGGGGKEGMTYWADGRVAGGVVCLGDGRVVVESCVLVMGVICLGDRRVAGGVVCVKSKEGGLAKY